MSDFSATWQRVYSSFQRFPFLRLFFILLLCVPSISYGQNESNLVTVLNLSQVQNKDISQNVKYFKYHSHELPDEDLDLGNWLKSLPKHTKMNPMGESYLAAFTLVNDTEVENWFIYPHGSPLEHVQLVQYSGTKFINKINSGLQHDNPMLFHNGGSIKIGANEQVTVVILFESQVFVAPIKIVVKSEKSAFKQFEIENIVLILSLGVCLALGLYNCFIYIGTGAKQYLYYALSTFGFTFSWAFIFGFVNYFAHGISLIWMVVGFSVGLYFVVLFTIAFLNLNKGNSKLYLYFKTLGVLSFLPSAVAFINVGLGTILISVCSMLILLTSLYFGLKSWHRGYRPARYFVLALLFVLVPNIIVNLINLNVLPGFNINALLFAQLGNSLDSLLLAFALAEKVRLTNIQNAELTHKLELNVQQRTSQLSCVNQKLECLIQELQEANRAKTHFLASMSHEIRTPLTSIIGYAQSIQSNEVSLSQQPEVIEIIADNGNHLLSVINDILDISKIETNHLDFESIPTDLLSIIKQIEVVMHKRAKDKSIAFSTECHFPLPDMIMSDPTRLKQILFNLTNNALKFTEQGKVTLSLSLDNNALLFKVKDSGIGITEAQIASLFMPFQQAETSTSRKFGGTGLGLSISKHLAQGLGGQITVLSELNVGSEFVLTIPFIMCQKAKMIESIDELVKVKEPIVKQNTDVIDFNLARVLIADDHSDVRKLTTLLLENMHCEVTSVASGFEALETVAKHSEFQLILLDIQMPELDGMQTLEKLRDLGCKAPIIAFTANNTQQEIERYLSVGFSSYISKPIDREQFKQTLSYYLYANVASKNQLSFEQQKTLTEDYYQDLTQSLKQWKQAIDVNDLQTQKEICHRIRGSAASFGFDLFSDVFTELETALNNSDEKSYQNLQNKVGRLTKRFTAAPYVDICQGINNHQFSLIKFQSQLVIFLDLADSQIKLMYLAVENKQLPLIRSLIIKFMFEVDKYGLSGLVQYIDIMEEYYKYNQQDMSLYQKQLSMLSRKLDELKVWFKSSN